MAKGEFETITNKALGESHLVRVCNAIPFLSPRSLASDSGGWMNLSSLFAYRVGFTGWGIADISINEIEERFLFDRKHYIKSLVLPM